MASRAAADGLVDRAANQGLDEVEKNPAGVWRRRRGSIAATALGLGGPPPTETRVISGEIFCITAQIVPLLLTAPRWSIWQTPTSK